MRDSLTITITTRDIRISRRPSDSECAVALAVRRVLGSDWRVAFGYAYDGSKPARTTPILEFPAEVRQFMLDEVNGRPLQPLTFTLIDPKGED